MSTPPLLFQLQFIPPYRLFFEYLLWRERGLNYTFLTLKERDNETGLDYFLARHYSSTQGRFTSPDEFTGGPDELYDFVDAASENPTFYADLTNPQSLNKYQYTYNNPLNMVDPDGHCPPEAAALCSMAWNYKDGNQKEAIEPRS